MKICVGIISYLPDDEKIREHRKEKLACLIKTCNMLFNLPILIVAQNGKDEIVNRGNVTIFKYENKLGITGARRKLREHFLNSEYDYLIMLDDDSELIGTPENAYSYVSQIKNHPGMGGAYKESLLKLFAISKEMFKLIDYPEGEAENGDFFEDMYMVKALRKLYPNKEFRFSGTGLQERSDSAKDPYSTWFHGQFNKHHIGDRTRSMIGALKNENTSSKLG